MENLDSQIQTLMSDTETISNIETNTASTRPKHR